MTASNHAKHLLRKRLQHRRQLMTAVERERQSAQITQHLLAWPKLSGCARVALYAAFGSEVATAQLHDALRQRGVGVVYPRLAGEHLTFHQVDDVAALREAEFRIAAPCESAPRVELKDVELVVLPGLGFDRHGGRLGYGKGFYDRALQDHVGVTVGLCYTQTWVEQVPRDSWDRVLDYVVLPHGVVTCSPEG
jgi:5-formyltetrahydrofolate cyclo-ligase